MTGSRDHLLTGDGRQHSHFIMENNKIWIVNHSIPVQKYPVSINPSNGLQDISTFVANNVRAFMDDAGNVSTLSFATEQQTNQKQSSLQQVQLFPQQSQPSSQQIPLSQQFQPSRQQFQPSQQQQFQPSQQQFQFQPSQQQFQSSQQRFQFLQKQSFNQRLPPMQLQYQRQNLRMQLQPHHQQLQPPNQQLHHQQLVNNRVNYKYQIPFKPISTSGSDKLVRQLLVSPGTHESQNSGDSNNQQQCNLSLLQGNMHLPQQINNSNQIPADLSNNGYQMSTAGSLRSNDNQNNNNENHFDASPSINQVNLRQPMTMQEVLNKTIFTEYSKAAEKGRVYLETFHKNYKTPKRSSVSDALSADDNDESSYAKICEQTFNITKDYSPVNEEQHAMIKWYKEPSFQFTPDVGKKNVKRKHSTSDTNETLNNCSKSPKLDNSSSSSQDVEIVADINKEEESVEQRREVSNSEDPFSSSYITDKTISSAKMTGHPMKDLGVSTGSSSDVENNHYLKADDQRENRASDSNVTELMAVMSAKSPQFMIYFHGRKILCLSKQEKKYVILRELIFYFFKDTIGVVKETISELGITKTMLDGKEKRGVLRYLLHQKIFSDKTTKQVGIIQIEDATRLYHELSAQSNCDGCVKLVIKKSSPAKTDATNSTTVTTTKNMCTSSVSSQHNTKSTKSKPKESVSKQCSTITPEDGESDSTLPYDDNDDDDEGEKSIYNKEYFHEEKGLVTAGVINLEGNRVRYICRKSILFVPLKDIYEHFSTDVINETLERTACKTTRCREMERDSFLQFSIGLEEVMPGDILVDSRIVEYMHLVSSRMEGNPTVVENDPPIQIPAVEHDSFVPPDDSSRNKYRNMFNKFTSFCKKTMNKRFKHDEHG